eukprot:CAMPEP_0171106554 /NCGR_PEP_ID=MMETSP0766_2-20121228/65005_1 /TAXON_ID=439317 /ORGANISM="Gambierdiscus australes, Strain CAWD 149" /LENGTH=33 /DNA_ID= /DNA_START= /DNA_END= /DNA_ORIENTATION=
MIEAVLKKYLELVFGLAVRGKANSGQKPAVAAA